MKRLIFSLLFVVALFNGVSAQKFGYVDTEVILKKMPEYDAIQKEMDQLSNTWQKELDDMYAKIEKKFQDYRAKEVLLSKEDKDRIQNEILEDERKAKEFQKAHFGVNGKLFQKREEKMRPIHQKIFNAVEAVAKEKIVDIIFDRASDVVMLYANPRFDYSDAVMRKLGIDPSAAAPDGGRAAPAEKDDDDEKPAPKK